MELFSPEIRVAIGGYTFSRGFELELNSCEDTYYDWAKVRFVSPFEQKVTLARLDPATILLGYNGSFETSFVGYATCDFVSGTTGNEIVLKDGMMLLETVQINNTFLQVTPQEIVSYVANQAGITALSLDETPYPPVACLPIVQRNGIQAIRDLDACWRTATKFYFQGGALHWGKADEQAEVYHFEYAKNIISLQRDGGYWELQTVSVPFVRHSQTIRITHPKVSGDFKVHRVRVSSRGPGFIRTTLYFEEAA
jgi:hypothetical protein